MAHLVFIENQRGDILDYGYYCSDGCAKIDPLYAGWNGCHEMHQAQWCANCGDALGYWCEERDEWISPEQQEHETAEAMYSNEVTFYQGRLF
jgi:hypothetical protein